jgi:hypothetical protein
MKLGFSETVVNENGSDIDFRVEGDTNANLLFVDASTDRVGIGTASPTEVLHVVGDILATGGDFKSDANNYLGFSNNTFARFVINDSEKMRIINSGAMLLGTTTAGSASAGDLVVNGGVFLGGSAAANELDDYEEGTWTPSSTFANDTASGQAGAYTKVGNMVVATFQIVFSTTSFGVNAALSGLPFTSNSTTGNASGASIGFYNGTSTTLQLYLAENSTQLNLRDIDGDIQHNSAKVTGKTLRGVVVYRTT